MAGPFLGEIEYFAFNYPPKGWAQCMGQVLPVGQNQALFSLLGTTFGGDGTTTFGLPDLRSRIVVGQGAGSGLSGYTLGQTGGSESVQLTTLQMPAHTHSPLAVAQPSAAPVGSPADNLLSVGANDGQPINIYATGNATGAMDPNTVSNTGTGQGHENRMPYLPLLPCIALVGVFPTRN